MTAEGPVEIRARRGVLIASGGFEGNAALRATHGVPGDAAWSMAPRGTNTGEPIAAAVGDRRRDRSARPGLVLPRAAAARRRRLVHPRLPRRPDGGRDRPPLRQRVPALRPVRSRDGEGCRADPVVVRLRHPRGRPAAGDLDARGRPGRAPRGTAPGCRRTTVAELAEAMGVPADALVETVERFNGFAAAGADDDFGRGDDEYDTFFAGGGGPNTALLPLAQAPFFAARFVLVRPRHQGRPGHRRRRPRAARGRLADRRPLRHQQLAANWPARSTPAPASRSARRWCSPRSPSTTSWREKTTA